MRISDTTLIGVASVRRRRARARRGAARVVGRPRVAGAHRRGSSLFGWAVALGAQRPRREPVPAVLGARRRRASRRPTDAGLRIVAGRHVPDPRPRADLRAVLHGAADRSADRPVRRRARSPNVAGGPEGWRWVYFVVAVPTALLGDRRRVRSCANRRAAATKQELVLGGRAAARRRAQRELPVSMSTAYQRMKKIKTFYYICIGIGVLGFAFVAVPIQLGLLLEEQLRLRRVHARLGHVARRRRVARRDPDRRVSLRPRVPPGPRSASCASPAMLIFGLRAASWSSRCGCTRSRCSWRSSRSPTRARAPRSSASARSSARSRRTGCARRRSR